MKRIEVNVISANRARSLTLRTGQRDDQRACWQLGQGTKSWGELWGPRRPYASPSGAVYLAGTSTHEPMIRILLAFEEPPR